ncbi:restriction endonuclease [Streptomyces angustmyceticus]|uniref:restriction endonuclease n=1 Tax=Streptomyces angustmyceticus TaxID=285578 RepID=UPI00381BBF86
MAAPVRRPQRATTRRTVVFYGKACGLMAGIAMLVLMIHDGLGAGAAVLLVTLVGGVLAVRRARAADRARLREIRAARSMEIGRYHAMNPREFEEAIAFLCRRDGCRDARRVGGAGDLGADVTAVAPDGRRIVIQCKRYGPTSKVGSPDLQRFGGTCYSVHGAQVAAVVTTSVFTRPAADYAVQQGIRPYDQNALAAWASRTGPAPWM